jgi:hypothetical protein
LHSGTLQILSKWQDGLGTYQKEKAHGAGFNSESGELPTGSPIGRGLTSCVMRLRFSFFPHTVVRILPLAALQELAFAAVELARGAWERINSRVDDQRQLTPKQMADRLARRKSFVEGRCVCLLLLDIPCAAGSEVKRISWIILGASLAR